MPPSRAWQPPPPRRNDVIDGAGALGLTLLALIGFRTTFAGSLYLLSGTAAALLAVPVAYLAVRARASTWIRVAGALVVFVVASGPLALTTDAFVGLLPTPASLAALADGLINGWARLLTSVPPSGNTGHVLVVPYLCGFVGAGGAMLLALELRRHPLCVLPPTLVLALSILFGTEHPAALVLQGGVFAAASLAWAAHRTQRQRTVVLHRTRAFRVGGAAGLLAVAGGLATIAAPDLPLASGHVRVVLRQEISPPFNPEGDPSPLVAYRRYVTGAGAGAVLATLHGFPAGVSLQVAVLDGYDGTVWATTGSGTTAGGTYERVGPVIPGAAAGRPERFAVTIGALHGVFLPTAGDVSSVTFTSPNPAALTKEWRFDLATESAALPSGLVPGVAYQVQGTLPSIPSPAVLRTLPLDPTAVIPPPPDMPQALATKAVNLVAGAKDPYDQAVKLAAWFRQGFYSDGGPNSGVPPGHSLARLIDFLASAHPVGDAEQYAAAMGLLARSLGMPVRVVVGFRPGSSLNGTVVLHGKALDAWVEIDFARAGWVPFYPTPPRTRTATVVAPQQVRPVNTQSQPPPPTTLPPVVIPPAQGQARAATVPHPKPNHKKGNLSTVVALLGLILVGVGIPVVVLGAPILAVLALKARRRRRRRARPDPASVAAGAWDEVIDLARDMRCALPSRGTRPETAAVLPAQGAVALAEHTDAVVFGPHDPSPFAADELWRRSAETSKAMLAGLPGGRRLRARLSLRSLRRSGAERVPR